MGRYVKNKRNIQVFLMLIFLGLILRLLFVFTIPMYPHAGFLPGYNDEPLHLYYVQHLAAGSGIPVYEPTGIDSIDHIRGEFVQPPLYYKAAVPAYKFGEFLHIGWGLYAVRLMSAIFGIVAGIFAYRLAYLWTNRRRVAQFTLAAMMFAPNAVLFTALVSNDALLICLSVMTLYSISLCREKDSTGNRLVITGAFLAAAVWVKLSAIVLLPLIVFCVSPGTRVKQRLSGYAKVFITFTLIMMPMIIWSIANYGQPYPGGGVAMQAQYQPEAAVGVSGGAIYHPFMAVKMFLRTASMPFLELWGSKLEKFITVIWLVTWSLFLALGTLKSLRQKPYSSVLVTAIVLMTTAFILRSIFLFQVEFRLYAPVFGALAVLTALGYELVNLPLWLHALMWCAPFLVILFV